MTEPFKHHYTGEEYDFTGPPYKEVEVVTFSSDIAHIETHAFYQCNKLESINLPITITTIKYVAFAGCINLTSIAMPNSLTTIEGYAFCSCSKLKSVTLPNSLTTIGPGAFSHCSSLELISIPAAVTTIEQQTFDRCSNLKSINLPPNITIEKWAFKGCSNLQSISITTSSGTTTEYNTNTPTDFINIPHSIIIKPDAFDHYDENINIARFNKNVPPTLHDTFEEGEGATLGFLGATQKGYGPEKWGIKLEQIEHLYNNHPYSKANPGLSMRDFVNKVIIPITKGKGVGYALLVNQKKPLQAKVMVSHSWEEPVEHFIECIRRSDVKEEALWICALSIHQSNDEADGPTIDQQLGPNPEFGPFVTVLRCTVLMIVVITDACDIYTRLWCDYEMHTAQMLKVKVKLCPHARYDNLGDDVCIKNLTKRVNSEKAFCSWEPDRKSIHDVIMSQSPNGFEDINMSVEKIRLQYFLEYPADKITATNEVSKREAFFLEYPADKITATNEESKREAFERYLVSSIETMVCRIYTIAVNKLPHFQYFHENQSEEEPSDLILAFREWKESVEKLISEQEERSSQKD